MCLEEQAWYGFIWLSMNEEHPPVIQEIENSATDVDRSLFVFIKYHVGTDQINYRKIASESEHFIQIEDED